MQVRAKLMMMTGKGELDAEKECSIPTVHQFLRTRCVELEADTITCISTTGFTRSCDFDHLSSTEAIIPSHWISELNARELRLLQPARVEYNIRDQLKETYKKSRTISPTTLSSPLGLTLRDGEPVYDARYWLEDPLLKTPPTGTPKPLQQLPWANKKLGEKSSTILSTHFACWWSHVSGKDDDPPLYFPIFQNTEESSRY